MAAIDKISGVSFSGIDDFSGVATSGIDSISGVTASSTPSIITANLVNRYTPANYSGTGALLDEVGSQDITISGATYNSSTPAHFDFDGVNDQGASSTTTWTPTDISIGYWMNQDDINGIQVPSGLFGGSGTRGFFNYSYIFVGGRLIFTNSSNQASQDVWTTPGNYPLNQWIYICMTRDNTTRLMNMWLGTSTGLTQVITNYSTNTAGTFNNSAMIYSSGVYNFDGSLGELHHYDAVLSQSNWLQNFNATKAYYGL